MAKLAYCKQCRATYPLIIVVGDGRSGKTREPACPMGHTKVEEIDAPRRQGGKK